MRLINFSMIPKINRGVQLGDSVNKKCDVLNVLYDLNEKCNVLNVLYDLNEKCNVLNVLYDLNEK